MKLNRESIRAKLPTNLEAIAKAAKDTKALLRRREVKSAEQLIWMALMYSGLAGSLRSTAALGTATGDFDMNDTSVRNRLKNSVELLTAVLNHLLFGSARIFAAQGIRRRICLQDATVVTIPGSKGTDFRLHTEYVPGQGLAYVEITDNKGAESLKRGEYGPGDIVIADQGLGHSADIHHVNSTGAHCIVRVYLPTVKLEDDSGKRLEVARLLDFADQGAGSLEVRVPHKGSEHPVHARLVMARLPPEQAVRARERLRKRSSKKQHKHSDLALRLAGYVLILTTVPESDMSDREILKTYRLRWQIELFFKRCKSLVKLDELAAGGRVAMSWLLGKLIIAALIDQAILNLKVQQSGTNGRLATENLWRLTKLCLLDLEAAIVAIERDQPILADKALHRITEPPRKRRTAAPKIDAVYAKLNPDLATLTA